jgi:hypothetical protein
MKRAARRKGQGSATKNQQQPAAQRRHQALPAAQ